MLNALFGLSCGGIIAGTYLIMKLAGAKGGIDVVCISSFIIFLIHITIWPKLTVSAFNDKRTLLRGLAFALSQVFLLKAQSVAPTSTMLIASIAGALAGSWLGKLVLKEHPSWNEVLAIVIAIGGTLLASTGTIEANIWATIGGLIQGLNSVVARSLMKNKISRRGAVGSGLFILGLTMLVVLLINKDANSVMNLKWSGIFAVGGAVVISQYAFFQLYKIYSTQKATVFTLLRAPWSVALEGIFLGAGVGLAKVISSVIVFLAALIALYKPRNREPVNNQFHLHN